MLKLAFYSVIFFYFINFCVNVFKLQYTKSWIAATTKGIVNRNIKNKKKLYLIIPVLNEQKIIEQSVKHFMEIAYKFEEITVVFVTSDKEGKGEKSTYFLINKMLPLYDREKIMLIHYPKKNGVMAHQINYAFNTILKKEINKDFWIGIYNVDSRISFETIIYIRNQINSSINQNRCYQQYSYYSNVYHKKSILGSEELWQNRWTLCFEIYRSIVQLKMKRYFNIRFSGIKELIFEKMNYIIGHGFFIHSKLLESIGGLPENTINEDAFMGYLLNCMRVDIFPIPYLEKAYFVNSLQIYLKQQAVWFNGPLYAFKYFNLIKKNQLIEKGIRNFVLAIKLFMHAIYWLCSPILLLVVLPCLASNKIQIIIWGIIVIINLPVFNFMIRNTLKEITNEDEFFPKASILYCPIAYFIHCVGPALCIVKTFFGRNTIENKYKTEKL